MVRGEATYEERIHVNAKRILKHEERRQREHKTTQAEGDCPQRCMILQAHSIEGPGADLVGNARDGN